MNAPVTAGVLQAMLAERGLISADAPPPAQRRNDRPWFVSLMLSVAGWLAGLFGLAFFGMLFKPTVASEFSLAGLVMLAAAFGLYAIDRDSAFFDQLALALSIAGQLALAWAASRATDSPAAAAALVTLTQLVLVVIMPNRLARFLSTFFACIAWSLAIRFAWWDQGSSRALGSQDVSLGAALAGWFVIWIPVIALTLTLIAKEARWMANGAHKILRPVLNGLLLSLAFGTLFSQPLQNLGFGGPGSGAHTNWLVLWPLLAVAASMVAALGAFTVRNRALLGAAIAAALLHVVQFYYLLGTTLLTKSAIMLVVGGALIVGGICLHRRSSRPAEEAT